MQQPCSDTTSDAYRQQLRLDQMKAINKQWYDPNNVAICVRRSRLDKPEHHAHYRQQPCSDTTRSIYRQQLRLDQKKTSTENGMLRLM